MIDSLALSHLTGLLENADGAMQVFLTLFPFFILLELPVYLIVLAGILRWYLRNLFTTPQRNFYTPKVSCIITCYAEGSGVATTLLTLCEQIYPGHIELIPVVDGASANTDTMKAVNAFQSQMGEYPNRSLRPLAKWQRGGRVSSLNAGLEAATGEIVLALDGDTSFDNTTVASMVRHFQDPSVPAVAGSLRVRNHKQSLITRIQALEYFLSIHVSKIGLSEWNTVNNISGAFGAFRKSFLKHIGGWDTHTAEDLDLTLRIKSYFGRRKLKIPFEPMAIGHTDAPSSLKDFLLQRLRWDGDLYFLYIRKHAHSLNGTIMGWKNFLITLVTGLFHQLVLPFLIVGYTLAALIWLPVESVITVFVLVYGVYSTMTILLFITGILTVSSRLLQDLKMAAIIPIFPLFMFMLRCWGVVCTLNEVFRRGHEETSMAPWWVIRRGRRF